MANPNWRKSRRQFHRFVDVPAAVATDLSLPPKRIACGWAGDEPGDFFGRTVRRAVNPGSGLLPPRRFVSPPLGEDSGSANRRQINPGSGVPIHGHRRFASPPLAEDSGSSIRRFVHPGSSPPIPGHRRFASPPLGEEQGHVVRRFVHPGSREPLATRRFASPSEGELAGKAIRRAINPGSGVLPPRRFCRPLDGEEPGQYLRRIGPAVNPGAADLPQRRFATHPLCEDPGRSVRRLASNPRLNPTLPVMRRMEQGWRGIPDDPGRVLRRSVNRGSSPPIPGHRRFATPPESFEAFQSQRRAINPGSGLPLPQARRVVTPPFDAEPGKVTRRVPLNPFRDPVHRSLRRVVQGWRKPFGEPGHVLRRVYFTMPFVARRLPPKQRAARPLYEAEPGSHLRRVVPGDLELVTQTPCPYRPYRVDEIESGRSRVDEIGSRGLRADESETGRQRPDECR